MPYDTGSSTLRTRVLIAVPAIAWLPILLAGLWIYAPFAGAGPVCRSAHSGEAGSRGNPRAKGRVLVQISHRPHVQPMCWRWL